MSRYQPVRLAYEKIESEVETDASLSPIIFLHGLLLYKEYWENIPKAVADSTKRIAYVVDFRNHGDSEWSEDFNFDLNAKDVLHFMDTLGISKAILVGHSMGGAAAIKVALNEPERVEKIVAEDIGVTMIEDESRKMASFMISIARTAAEEASPELSETEAKQFIFKCISNCMPEYFRKSTDLDTIKIKRAADGRWTYRANLKAIEVAMKSEQEIMSEHAGVYRGPACFIYGTQSPLDIGTKLDDIRKYFSSVEFVAIEGAAHGVHTDKPLEFTQVLIEFLSQN